MLPRPEVIAARLNELLDSIKCRPVLARLKADVDGIGSVTDWNRDRLRQAIEGSKGRMVVKEEARAVSEKEERALEEELQAAEAANREVSGDTDEVRPWEGGRGWMGGGRGTDGAGACPGCRWEPRPWEVLEGGSVSQAGMNRVVPAKNLPPKRCRMLRPCLRVPAISWHATVQDEEFEEGMDVDVDKAGLQV